MAQKQTLRSQIKFFCSKAGCKNFGTKYCGHCYSIFFGSYCSVECQKSDWPKHKATCRKLAGGQFQYKSTLQIAKQYEESGQDQSIIRDFVAKIFNVQVRMSNEGDGSAAYVPETLYMYEQEIHLEERCGLILNHFELGNIAMDLIRLGRVEEGNKVFDLALKMLKENGCTNEELVRFLKVKAAFYREQNKIPEAVETDRQITELTGVSFSSATSSSGSSSRSSSRSSSSSSPNHRFAAAASQEAISLISRGDYPGCISYCNRTLPVLKKKNVHNTLEAALICQMLGCSYCEMGEMAKGFKFLDEASTLFRVNLSDVPPQEKMSFVACLISHLNYLERGHTDGSDKSINNQQMKLLREAFEILQAAGEGNHQGEAGAIRHYLGKICRVNNQFEKAERHLLKAREYREFEFQENPLQKEIQAYLAETCQQLGYLYQAMKEYSKALPVFKRVLEMWMVIHPPTHACDRFNEIYLCIGNTYFDLGEFDEARLYYDKLLANLDQMHDDELHGRDPHGHGRPMNSFMQMLNPLPFGRKAFEHAGVVATRFYDKQMYPEAEFYYEQAWRKSRALQGDSLPDTLMYRRRLASSLFNQLGKERQAIKHFEALVELEPCALTLNQDLKNQRVKEAKESLDVLKARIASDNPDVASA